MDGANMELSAQHPAGAQLRLWLLLQGDAGRGLSKTQNPQGSERWAVPPWWELRLNQDSVGACGLPQAGMVHPPR